VQLEPTIRIHLAWVAILIIPIKQRLFYILDRPTRHHTFSLFLFNAFRQAFAGIPNSIVNAREKALALQILNCN
jgi:hypothetical protein